MADSDAFQSVAEALEQTTDLDRLEARGTLRLALKQAGLDAKSVRASELAVVIERILPTELSARGVGDTQAVVARLRAALPADPTREDGDSPESVFRRLGGEG